MHETKSIYCIYAYPTDRAVSIIWQQTYNVQYTTTYAVHLRLIAKRVADFLLVAIELKVFR